MKSQSAMEYLMTYGWAILIIAVVLGALYSLGLFNSISIAPRTQPGACQIFRPNGAFTTAYISTAGSCTNELPQYVAYFSGGNYITTTGAGMPVLGAPVSTFAWIYYTGNTIGSTAYFVDSYGSGYYPWDLFVWSDLLWFGGSFGDFSFTGQPIAQNTWYFVGYTFSGTPSDIATLYINGKSSSTPVGASASWPTSGSQEIGYGESSDLFTPNYFKGMIANVQVYNSSLDANSVKALYQEGIGGAPINLQNLVGWWPLNGNANDYSGNANQQVSSTGIIYTNQWTGGYTVT